MTNSGEMMKKLLRWATAASCLVALDSVVQARSIYDGSWDLFFVTHRAECDSTCGFSINLADGIVTHPDLVKFRGYVARSSAVRASVTVNDKYAAGTGRLSAMPAMETRAKLPVVQYLERHNDHNSRSVA